MLTPILLKNPDNPWEIATKTYTYLISHNADLAKEWLKAYRACHNKKDVLALSNMYVSFTIAHDYRRLYDEY